MSRCGDGILTRTAYGVTQVVTQSCKCAGCENCAPGYRRRIATIAASGRPTKLLTFTAPPHHSRTPAQQAREMIKHANAFRRHWNTKHPKQIIKWFWVPEAHKSGWPHLHILMPAGFIPIKLLRLWMLKRMRAKNTSIEPIRDPTKAKNYITKYLTKALDKFEGVARWGRSRGYGERTVKTEHFPELADSHWERSDDKPATVIHRYLMKGWRLDPSVRWCAILRHPP